LTQFLRKKRHKKFHLTQNHISTLKPHLILIIFRQLGLRRPIYQKTAENGHFGHEEFPWEQPRDLFIAKNIQEKLHQHAQEIQPESQSLQQTA
jgi:S-adenosylmethionine synthetase